MKEMDKQSANKTKRQNPRESGTATDGEKQVRPRVQGP